MLMVAFEEGLYLFHAEACCCVRFFCTAAYLVKNVCHHHVNASVDQMVAILETERAESLAKRLDK